MTSRVSSRMPMPKKNSARNPYNSIFDRRRRSSCSSVARSSSRVWAIPSKVPSNVLTEASKPVLRVMIAGDLIATRGEIADDEADAAGNDDRLPGVIMHVIVRGSGGFPGLVEHGLFRRDQLVLGARQTTRQRGAQFGNFLTGLAGRCTQYRFCIRDHSLEIGNQFFVVCSASSVHDMFPFGE